MNRRSGLASALVIAAALAPVPAALAQGYPAKPVRLILSYPPGGMTDTLGRLVAKELSETWGSPVVVDNRPGASGNIGTTACVRAPADGYTMCTVALAQAMASRIAAVDFNSLTDFSHVSLIASVPMLLLAHPSVPARNVAELVALAKRRPGELNYASSGGGAGPQLAMELLKQQAGVNIVLITYKGTGAAIVDQMAGRVELAFNPTVGVVQYLNQGRLRALAVSTKERFPPLATIPTVHESGLRGYDASSWQGISMPANVPRDLVRRVSGQIAAIVKRPEMRERIYGLGGIPVGNTAEEFHAFFNAESDKWFAVAKKAGIAFN